MPDADGIVKDAREELRSRSIRQAEEALARIRQIRKEFDAEGAVKMVATQLTPDPKASRFLKSTLHRALQPFAQLGNTDAAQN
jgi:hypothetical protein